MHEQEKGRVQSLLPLKDKQEALACIKEDKNKPRGFSLMPDTWNQGSSYVISKYFWFWLSVCLM